MTSCTFKMPKTWIIEMEINLSDAKEGAKISSVPILVHGPDISIECADLFKGPGEVTEFCRRLEVKSNKLAVKKLADGRVGFRPKER